MLDSKTEQASLQTIFSKRVNLLFAILVFFLVIPSFYTNLGSHHLFVHTDEPRRALVSLEMLLQDSFWVPTLYGEPYLNKPPLFNWMIAASYLILGDFSEFAVRLPSTFSLFALVGLMYLFVRHYRSSTDAFFIAMGYMTCARILFFDSFLGMIDFPFALVSFAQIAAVYHFYKQKKLMPLYLVTYSLMGIGFLTKGLPSVVFQGFSLLALVVSEKKWKFLFSPYHLLGVLAAFFVIGGYYTVYFSKSTVSYEQILSVLWGESSKRTVLRFGFVESLMHSIRFPFELIGNFLPWTFPLLFLVSSKIRAAVLGDGFCRFALFATLLNLIVYWVSPEVHPRYLLMLVPFLLIVSFCGVIPTLELKNKKIWDYFLKGIMGALVLSLTIVPYFEAGRNAPSNLGYGPLVFVVSAVVVLWVMWKTKASPILGCITLLFLTRWSYALYLLPQRAHDREDFRTGAISVGKLTKGKPLWILGEGWVQDGTGFYLSRERREILRKKKYEDYSKDELFIAREWQLNGKPHTVLYSFKTMFEGDPLKLVRFK